MGVTKKPSGVNIIGLGAADLNEFKPVDQLKDLYIQLTADGATEESMDYLAYLKSYAEHNQSIGLPIMPNGVNVWISNNGKTSAVEADDLSLEDGVYTICGITCTDGEWDFTNAGQHSGGGGSDLPEVDDADNGKVLTVVDGAWAAASGGGGGGGLPDVSASDNGKFLEVQGVPGTETVFAAEQTITFDGDSTAVLTTTGTATFSDGDYAYVTVGGVDYVCRYSSFNQEFMNDVDTAEVFFNDEDWCLWVLDGTGSTTVSITTAPVEYEPAWNDSPIVVYRFNSDSDHVTSTRQAMEIIADYNAHRIAYAYVVDTSDGSVLTPPMLCKQATGSGNQTNHILFEDISCSGDIGHLNITDVYILECTNGDWLLHHITS